MDEFENTNQMNELITILKDIQSNEQKEMKYARRQSRFAIFVSIICLIVVAFMAVTFFTVLPKVNSLLGNTKNVVENADEIVVDLKKVTTELASINMKETIDNINRLVIESEKNVNLASDNINNIDFEGLNKAIKDLSDVVEPLAKFFRR